MKSDISQEPRTQNQKNSTDSTVTERDRSGAKLSEKIKSLQNGIKLRKIEKKKNYIL